MTCLKNELAEKSVLDEYLPKMMTGNELEEAINNIMKNINATSMKDMGNVMKELSLKYPNQYDGKTASSLIKTILSK